VPLGEASSLLQHPGGIEAHRLGADRPVDDLRDPIDHFLFGLAARLAHERRVRRYAAQDAPARDLTNLIDSGSVEKGTHLLASPLLLVLALIAGA
jgi:hypothetical protein